MGSANLEIQIIRREIVKPSSPTPEQSRHLKLSLLDQLAAGIYTPLLLFYQTFSGGSDLLRTSLAHTLTHFYPLAGRAKGNVSIECDDSGADFVEAKANCKLCHFLERPNPTELKKLLPMEIESPVAADGMMLLVQVTTFECGGLSLGVSVSHKIADASSMLAFIKSWASAAAAGSSSTNTVPPKFIGDSLIPQPGFPINVPPAELAGNKCMTSRLVFEGPKIAQIKSDATSAGVAAPTTRVEAVTALLWKTVRAAANANSETEKASVLSQTVNLRRRLEPPLPENTIGNLLGNFITQTDSNPIELKELVSKLREAMREFKESGVKRYQGENAFMAILGALKESGSLYGREDIEFYICSSWSGFDLYGANFGSGRPVWASIASLGFSNFFVLMDTGDGEGIEAWVTLSEAQMELFQRDPQLLQYASLNPPAV